MDIQFRHGKKRCESNMLKEGFLKLKRNSSLNLHFIVRGKNIRHSFNFLKVTFYIFEVFSLYSALSVQSSKHFYYLLRFCYFILLWFLDYRENQKTQEQEDDFQTQFMTSNSPINRRQNSCLQGTVYRNSFYGISN